MLPLQFEKLPLGEKIKWLIILNILSPGELTQHRGLFSSKAPSLY